MDEVKVSDLRAQLTATLARVEDGAVLKVTGRDVVLVSAQALERLAHAAEPAAAPTRFAQLNQQAIDQILRAAFPQKGRK